MKALMPIATTVLLCATVADTAQLREPSIARNLAATCTSCHGTGGVSRDQSFSLAGMKHEKMIRKLQDFKMGKQPATIMHQLAKGYTDEQLQLIAEWFAAQSSPHN